MVLSSSITAEVSWTPEASQKCCPRIGLTVRRRRSEIMPRHRKYSSDRNGMYVLTFALPARPLLALEHGVSSGLSSFDGAIGSRRLPAATSSLVTPGSRSSRKASECAGTLGCAGAHIAAVKGCARPDGYRSFATSNGLHSETVRRWRASRRVPRSSAQDSIEPRSQRYSAGTSDWRGNASHLAVSSL